MARTDNLRRQHKELLEVIQQAKPLLKIEQIVQNSAPIRKLLSILSGKLKVHLTMEYGALYQELLRQENVNVKSTAKQFVDEMEGLKTAFLDYIKKWPTPASIEKNSDEFIKETKSIFISLSDLIRKENDELYILLDNLS